ncbi:YqgE/AlgH family protein [Noviherbaspirillum malthae]|uniref:YqgE/AlgH family protein n=1 Tax=Noviherbaspirillum malthae TaxID=1260987 RepID=UPI003F6979B1
MPIMVKPSKSRTSSLTPGSARGVAGYSASTDEAPAAQFTLADHFLIAMPSMLDPVFGGTVVYICEHNTDGALGVIVNKTTDMTMDVLLERIDLGADPSAGRMLVDKKPVMFGGPVQVERGFVLHSPHGEYSSMMKVNETVALTTSKDVLEAVASGRGPERILVTLGCAGWSAGQLEEEIVRNGWLTVRAEPRIIFDVPAELRFTAAMKLLGIDPMMLTGDAGHA